MIRRFGPSALAFALITIAVHGFYVSRGDPRTLSSDEVKLVRGGLVPCWTAGTAQACPEVQSIPCLFNACIDQGAGLFYCANSTSPFESNPNGVPQCVQVTTGSGKDGKLEQQVLCQSDRVCRIGYECFPGPFNTMGCPATGAVTFSNAQTGCQAVGNNCEGLIAKDARTGDSSLLARTKGEAYPFN